MNDLKPYYAFIRNYMMKYGYKINRNDADDVFQRACVACLEQGDKCMGDNFYGYLKFSCLRFFGKDLPIMRRKDLGTVPEQEYSQIDAQETEMVELTQAIREEFNNLTKAEQNALLVEWNGISAEIAGKILDTTTMAQHVARHRAVRSMQDRLNRRGV